MRHLLSASLRGCIIILAAAGLCCSRPGADTLPTEVMTRVRSVDKMVLATMSITKTATLDGSSQIFGKRVAVYSYDTFLRATCDLSQLRDGDIRFDSKTRSVSITLPPVMTEVAGRDMELRKEYDNIGLLRDSLDSAERARLKEAANASLMRELDADPGFRRRLKETAERKARQYFEAMFAAEGYTATVGFRDTSAL